ncbi:MAG: mannose-1-phosphate guanylyltransferase/mannose-6-phosphate isomerase [Acidiphilium sp. 37-64-53]|uniref:mannose-1-phosphate guanylyltransferase/mannose-6-phosphate isomerase n=1 Tax=Acidiphilium TaxID=522 RepID=UPI000BC5471A|nr:MULTISPECIES: mannose-1-phosphate guanylyltransferase/mannose-6-phosphate isomerase [Acidiphilium]OYW04153.1 MAG: mannose-1-phosphate guanylyltransferase/mannose-6-phosphate isomerase [Acidiphilium sp. 37-64-53]HQT83398.1 mannose-1-phosphate guanylyltransferase/mannose-6-phosphate isomerase [Acidiphilium rubrum]
MADGTVTHNETIVPVILSGGTGTRLWPVSRKAYPKQFWSLVGLRTMLQETAGRAAGPGFAPPVVVANEEHRFIVAEQLREAGAAGARILLEPVGRNSAPAITAAALLIAEADPDQVLWIMAADAAIADLAALQDALAIAAKAAREGFILTFGMHPSAPETGYGYIEQGEALAGHQGAFRIARFVEKPDATTAANLLADGRHFWNSGMFVATARTLLSEIERHAPEVARAVRVAFDARKPDLDFIRLDAAGFSAAPDISIDYAIAEKTDHAAVVPAALGWSDVGSWAAIWEVADKDARGNATMGDAVIEDSDGCYVRSEGAVTAVLGLQDVVVVTTNDAVLVTHRSQTQNVKRVVERLKRDKRPEAEAHTRVYRPWGFYETLILGERFQVKRIVVLPGAKLSLQKHFHRAEHWVVVAGSALVTRDAEVHLIRENESLYLPLGCIHRMENPGKIPLTLIEVQSGSYLGEDDIVRFEDTYGRN